MRLHPRREASPPEPDDGGRVLAWHPPRTDYDRTIDRVLADIQPRIRAAERECAEAPFLLGELLRYPFAQQELLVRNSRRYHNLALCGLLLARSHRESAQAPRHGERLAMLALQLVGSLDAEWYGEWALSDARARCWMLVGNARRIACDLRGAEEAFRRAETHLGEGTGDEEERARLIAYRTELRRGAAPLHRS